MITDRTTAALHRLASRLLADQESNAVISPVGVWMALSVLAAGAGGSTATALDDLLGADGEDLAVLREELSAVLATVPGLSHASAVWSKPQLRPEFVESFPAVLFGNSFVQEELDAWVGDATGGRIDAFPIKVTPDDLLALADALTVTGTWGKPFNEHGTKAGDFTANDGSTVEVDFMAGHFPGRHFSHHGDIRIWTQSAKGQEGYTSTTQMRFAIGDEGTLREDVLHQVLQVPSPSDADSVIVRLPKYKLRQRTDLVTHLLKEAAPVSLSDDADFSGISAEEELKISKAAQACIISVEENGYEASAVTAVTMMRVGALPPKQEVVEHLNFDRPFAFAVVDSQSNLPLFVGWIDDPSALR